MKFEFATATRITFGDGSLQQVGSLAAGMGQRALVVVGGSLPRARGLLDKLEEAGIEQTLFQVTHEPTVELVRQGVDLAREEKCDLVIGFGGGSVLDGAKAISAMLTNEGDLFDYLEVIGRGLPLAHRSAPMIAIPTTAGTGTEVTRNAVLASQENRVKVSMRSPLMLPHLALIDPELTYSMPPQITANTGLDALTQVMEPYVSFRANPLTDALCLEGMKRVSRSLLQAYRSPDDRDARQDMAIGSLFGGLALANAGLGAVHGFAGPLGGMFSAPHGAVCGLLLPIVMETNVTALRTRQPDSEALRRYDEIARIVTGDLSAKAVDGVAWIQALCDQLGVPSLAEYGVTVADIPGVVAKASVASSMKANPIKLTPEELGAIIAAAI